MSQRRFLRIFVIGVAAWGTAVGADLGELRARAEQGDSVAQFQLGAAYERGEGVPKDAEAVRWYRKLAEAGDGEGQFYLARMYASGRGVPKDEAEAMKWFQKSADHGHEYGLATLA